MVRRGHEPAPPLSPGAGESFVCCIASFGGSGPSAPPFARSTSGFAASDLLTPVAMVTHSRGPHGNSDLRSLPVRGAPKATCRATVPNLDRLQIRVEGRSIVRAWRNPAKARSSRVSPSRSDRPASFLKSAPRCRGVSSDWRNISFAGPGPTLAAPSSAYSRARYSVRWSTEHRG